MPIFATSKKRLRYLSYSIKAECILFYVKQNFYNKTIIHFTYVQTKFLSFKATWTVVCTIAPNSANLAQGHETISPQVSRGITVCQWMARYLPVRSLNRCQPLNTYIYKSHVQMSLQMHNCHTHDAARNQLQPLIFFIVVAFCLVGRFYYQKWSTSHLLIIRKALYHQKP